MATDPYDLAELCDLAEVTPRTVRYYVQQGLLPSPGARGPGARYDRGHLDRLQLIKRLQREHLPLSEIRARLAGLSDHAVAALVREPPRPERHGGSALDYVRDVLAGRPAHHAPAVAPPLTPERRAAPARPSGEFTRLYELPPDALGSPAGAPPDAEIALGDPDANPPALPGPARSTWERVVLAPDVELHVRRPLSRAQNRLVDRLIEHARALFADPA